MDDLGAEKSDEDASDKKNPDEEDSDEGDSGDEDPDETPAFTIPSYLRGQHFDPGE